MIKHSNERLEILKDRMTDYKAVEVMCYLLALLTVIIAIYQIIFNGAAQPVMISIATGFVCLVMISMGAYTRLTMNFANSEIAEILEGM